MDPINLAEAMFALANILSFSRIVNIMPANEALGPMQISLGKMVRVGKKYIMLFLKGYF